MKSDRLRRLAVLETEKMIIRYPSECKELGSHFETEEEKRERLKRKEQKRKQEERYKLHI